MGKPFSIKERIQSFGFAFKGIATTFREEHNFRIHVLAALLVVSAGFYCSLSSQDWLWIITCIALVFSAELFNTAIEKLADETDPNQNPIIGKIKDASAGAVLVLSIATIFIGILIFWPYFCL